MATPQVGNRAARVTRCARRQDQSVALRLSVTVSLVVNTTIMALGPDEIPETALVGLIDRLNRTTRRDWADLGLLRKAGSGGGYGEVDAAELAAFFELQKQLGDYYDAVAAWDGIRPDLATAMSEDRAAMAEDRLIAVFDPEAQQGSLVTAEEEIGRWVMSRPQPDHAMRGQREHIFCAIDLSGRVRAAREAFWRAVEARNLRPSR
jgi:hypothetical protein